MPIYQFRHPEQPIVIEVVQSMKDPHVYVDDEGVEWVRVWSSPNAAMGMRSDPDSTKQFVDKTKGWTTGDMWDYSKDLSERRKSKRGDDHVERAYEKKRKSEQVRKRRQRRRDEVAKIKANSKKS